MRLKNLLLFVFPFLLSIIFSWIVGVKNPAIILAFFIIFDAVTSIISSFIFITYWSKSKKYEKFIKEYFENPPPPIPGKLAIVVPVFNEDPWTVVQTVVAQEKDFGRRG